MAASQTSDESTKGPLGIIDTIGAAFAILNQRPYLVWLPIALDVLLWLGFRFSPVGLADLAARRFPGVFASEGSFGEWLIDRFASSDLFYLVTILVPTMFTSLGRGEIAGIRDQATLAAGVRAEAAMLVALLAGGLVLGMTYLTMVGRLVQGQPAWGGAFFRLCFANTGRLVGFTLTLFGILALVGFPVAVLAVGLNFAGVNPATVVTMFLSMLGVWAGMFYFFGQYAIAIWSASPLEALRSSYMFVIRNLGQVLAFILLFVVIRTGTSVALRALTESPWSVPLALVINAYVATIMVAAAMMFYRDRALETQAIPDRPSSPAISTH